MTLTFSFLSGADANAAASGKAVVVPVFEGAAFSNLAKTLDEAADGALSKAAEAGDFTGKPGQTLEFLAPRGSDANRLVLMGLGEKAKLTDLAIEKAGAGVYKALAMAGLSDAILRLDAIDGTSDQAARAAFGAQLGAYRFDQYRTKLEDAKKPKLKTLHIAVGDVKGANTAWALWSEVAAGVYLARDLVNEPGNVIHPESFAAKVRELTAHGLEVEVLGEAEMEKLGMHMLLGVGLGSERESQLAIMRWNGAGDDSQPIAFVGKGVTFDTGGISLKPGDGMWDMKGDMGGAAAVTGAMRALAGRKAKVNAIGVIGLVENMPDAKAQRPGDIVTSMSGQTVEVLNTDAEGRLVLGDALWYTQDRFKPKFMVDLATLTGAIIITLANENAGLFASDDALADAIFKAGQSTDETVWRLPLGAGYDKLIDSKTADMKNIGGRGGGSITAAQFLKRFTNDTPWAHIDIASTAWKASSDDPREPSWGTGFGVRLLNELVRANYES